MTTGLLLLVRHSLTTATSRARVLATSTQVPVVTQTTVSADLLQALKVVTQLGLHVVGQDLHVLARREVLLPVEEPGGNLELLRSLEDVDNALELVRVQLTRAAKVSIHVQYRRVSSSVDRAWWVPSSRRIEAT